MLSLANLLLGATEVVAWWPTDRHWAMIFGGMVAGMITKDWMKK